MDIRTGNWVDVTVKEKKEFCGMFVLLAFHSYFAKSNAKQIRVVVLWKFSHCL
jgi:hypothetical protein